MKPNKKDQGGSRQGKHRPENVLLGAMVTPHKKAIAMVTAGVAISNGGMTITDLIWRGVANIAFTLGVIDVNGKVTDKYKDAVTLAEFQVGENQEGKAGADMRKLPSKVRKAAERIAAANGMTVEAVVEHYRLAVRKNRFTRKDSLLPNSAITLSD